VARYVALLRGVSPLNCSMPALRACMEAAGFERVKTLLSSGNVAFDARKTSTATLERRIEAALPSQLGRPFETFVRSSDELLAMLEADPYGDYKLPSVAKRVVTFLREPPSSLPSLPIAYDDAWIVSCVGREVFAAYDPNPRSPDFMVKLERAFGKHITTRTWDTVRKCAAA
jgi:uncharacterized protein (DUF1697 family)